MSSTSLTIEYFAVFRAQAKRASEEIPFEGSSLADLYEALRTRHGFALARDSVHVAVNDAYTSWDAVLQPGDRVVFIPPVSGG
jgi:molybdopterin converting factor subunit 1